MKITNKGQRIRNRGFSVIEMLVVIGVIAILSGGMLGFNRGSSKTIALTTEQSRVIGLLGRARSLALQKYTSGSDQYTCGIRVDVQQSSLIISAVVRGKTSKVQDCNSVASTTISQIEARDLEHGVTIRAGGPQQIYFSAPYLKTTFVPSSTPAIIELQAPGVSRIAKIEITSGGSIIPKID